MGAGLIFVAPGQRTKTAGGMPLERAWKTLQDRDSTIHLTANSGVALAEISLRL